MHVLPLREGEKGRIPLQAQSRLDFTPTLPFQWPPRAGRRPVHLWLWRCDGWITSPPSAPPPHRQEWAGGGCLKSWASEFAVCSQTGSCPSLGFPGMGWMVAGS